MLKACWVAWLSALLLNVSGQNPTICADFQTSIRLKKGQDGIISDVCACDSILELDLSHLKINSLPDCLFNLTGLRALNLSKTSIREIPAEIVKLESLELLDVSNTAVEMLPECLGALPNLKTLILKGTNVNVLPKGLENLKKIDLRYIDFTREEQRALRDQYPNAQIFLSSPCHCN